MNFIWAMRALTPSPTAFYADRMLPIPPLPPTSCQCDVLSAFTNIGGKFIHGFGAGGVGGGVGVVPPEAP
jgi:hypothetical protein